MASETKEPSYSGIDKFPGIIATVVTLIVGGVFLGALYNSATAGHGDDHGTADHGEAHAEPAGEAGAGH
jgi:hypothetical protein